MTADIAELLRSLPDLEPPAKAWQRIARQQARRKRLRRSGGFAVAASVLVALAIGALYFDRPVQVIDAPSVVRATAEPTIEPMIVSAPARQSRAGSAIRDIDPAIRALQERSRYMERLISGMPRRGPVAHADTAGVIAELEDRIAAVDYLLNREGWNRTASDGIGFDGRPQKGQSEALGIRSRVEPVAAPDLWRRRVEYMDQLVRARYLEADATGY